MIQWPCIFKLDGDDELLYLASEASLIAEFESLIWSDDDYLIDSQGQGYKVREVQAGAYTYEPFGNPLPVSEVTDLIQAHEFSKAEVCITKIQFLSVGEAIRLCRFSFIWPQDFAFSLGVVSKEQVLRPSWDHRKEKLSPRITRRGL